MLLSKRVWLAACLTVCLLGMAVPRLALAHEVATDGQMGVILHIGADDYPVTTEPQALVFYYNDLNRQFSTTNCACLVMISKGGKTYLNKIVPPSGTQVGKTIFTFPTTGIYQIVLRGIPEPSTAFTPFNVSYNILINKGSSQSSTTDTSNRATALFSALFGAGLLLLVAVGFYSYRKT